MIIESLQSLFSRDLLKLKDEVARYRKEENIWIIGGEISNSAGNLCLHLIGNLNAYIGVGLAGTAYIRKRDLEFSLKDVARTELLNKIDETMKVVETGLGNLKNKNLNIDFPLVIWERPTPLVYTLVHLSTHLNYHLGQVNYHRRLIDL